MEVSNIKTWENRAVFKNFHVKEGTTTFTVDGQDYATNRNPLYDMEPDESIIVYKIGEGVAPEPMYMDFEDIERYSEVVDELYFSAEKLKIQSILKKNKDQLHKAYSTNIPVTFTDQFPLEKSNNGGEYGFYTELIPTQYPGIFFEYTDTTCDFDTLGTGFVDVVFVTKDEYEQRKAASDEIVKEGYEKLKERYRPYNPQALEDVIENAKKSKVAEGPNKGYCPTKDDDLIH